MRRLPIVFAALLTAVSLLGCPAASNPTPSDKQESPVGQQTTESSANNSSSETSTSGPDSSSRPVTPVTDQDEPNGDDFFGTEDQNIPPEVLAVLLQDTDKDGRTDLDELAQGTDPDDPSDGPDIDGDGVPNGSDPDVDGDGIPNAYDDDVDGDGLLNKSDSDIDGDEENNGVDDDDDGDGIKDKKDNDDDADGKPDPGEAEGEECDTDVDCKDGEQCKDGDCAPFDLLALAVRLFDDAENKGEKPGLVAKGRQAFKEEASKPGDFDFQNASRQFFKDVMAEVESEASALEEAKDFYGRLFDQDHDGRPDFDDPDRDGNGVNDASEAQ